jgi:hypothetical protein
MMGTEVGPETFENFDHLIWLMARENVLKIENPFTLGEFRNGHLLNTPLFMMLQPCVL